MAGGHAHPSWVHDVPWAIIDLVPRTRDPYHQFGEWLRKTRDAIGLTQRELSVKMGRPTSFIGKVETAQRRLDIVEFEELALALGVSPVKLYERFLRTRE